MKETGEIIDAHVHPVSEDRVRYPLRAREGAGGPEGQARRPGEGGMVEKGQTTGEMLAAMDRAGVRAAVLVQSAALYGFDNSYIADSARLHRGRCIALCAVDILHESAAGMLSYWVEGRGCRGVRITQADALDEPSTFPLWERARELGIPIDLQVQPRHLEKLPAVLEQFPGVPVLIDHAGNVNRRLADGTTPATPPEALLALARFPNLYLKLTNQNVDGVREAGVAPGVFFGPLVEAFGARRLMWGSDFPATADQKYESRVAQAREAFGVMGEEEREWVMGRTAAAVWG
jgi:predicted TIM-barrel fold metal-dependent hydrolase